MPDGDCIERLPRRYRSAFQQLCEDRFDAEVTASIVAARVKKDLRDFTDSAVLSIHEAAAYLKHVQHDAQTGMAVPWGEVYAHVRDIVGSFRLNKLPMNLVVNVCHTLIHGFEHGIWSEDVCGRAVSAFVDATYSSRFEAHVPGQAALEKAAPPPEILASRLMEMRARAAPILERFEKILREGKSVGELQMPPRRRHPIDYQEDLSLGVPATNGLHRF